MLNSTSNSTFSIDVDDKPLLACFLNHPVLAEIQYPLDYDLIHYRQFLDIQFILNQQTTINFMIFI